MLFPGADMLERKQINVLLSYDVIVKEKRFESVTPGPMVSHYGRSTVMGYSLTTVTATRCQCHEAFVFLSDGENNKLEHFPLKTSPA
jgi:hypothetical protein